jgi:hypothetical protein
MVKGGIRRSGWQHREAIRIITKVHCWWGLQCRGLHSRELLSTPHHPRLSVTLNLAVVQVRRVIKLAYGSSTVLSIDEKAVLDLVSTAAPHKHSYETKDPQLVFGTNTTRHIFDLVSAEMAQLGYTQPGRA